MERDTFVFYPSFLDGIEKLPEGEQLKAYRMIAHYGVYGEEPKEAESIASAVYFMAIPSIDSAKKNRKNGAKGGRPAKNSKTTDGFLKEKPVVTEKENHWLEIKKPEAETYEDVYVYEDVYEDNNKQESLKEASKKEKVEKPIRHKYGLYNNVLLSDVDMEKLKQEFPYDWQERIEKLSEYIEVKGVTYKNHLATIRSWARRQPQPSVKVNLKPYIMTEEDAQRDNEAKQYLEKFFNERGKRDE